MPHEKAPPTHKVRGQKKTQMRAPSKTWDPPSAILMNKHQVQHCEHPFDLGPPGRRILVHREPHSSGGGGQFAEAAAREAGALALSFETPITGDLPRLLLAPSVLPVDPLLVVEVVLALTQHMIVHFTTCWHHLPVISKGQRLCIVALQEVLRFSRCF